MLPLPNGRASSICARLQPSFVIGYHVVRELLNLAYCNHLFTIVQTSSSWSGMVLQTAPVLTPFVQPFKLHLVI